jgi:hypothetical protein
MSLEFALMRNGLRAVYAALNEPEVPWCFCYLRLFHAACDCRCHEGRPSGEQR